MKVTRLGSTATVNPPRFASFFQILGFGVAVCLLLLITYLNQNLVERLQNSDPKDAVSLAYLRIWIHAKPDAYALRLVLARHELTHGNLYASEQVLQPMLNAADVTPQELIRAQFLLLKIKKYRMWQLNPHTLAYVRAKEQYLQQLRMTMRHVHTRKPLEEFAQEAMALGDAKLSYDLYAQLIQDHRCAERSWYEKVAQLDIGTGHYRQAAKRYFDVAACTRDATQQRADILTGLQTLMAGHHLQDAARASEQYFSVLRDDREALMFLTRLALASNHPELAEKYVARLLQQRIHRTHSLQEND